jgi:hypothetical protein
MTEIRNRETLLGIGDTNADGSSVKEVVDDEGNVAAEIHNRETLLGIGDMNADGSPVQEVVPTGERLTLIVRNGAKSRTAAPPSFIACRGVFTSTLKGAVPTKAVAAPLPTFD